MESWIGEAVGKMHLNKITQKALAEKMGYTADYISMIFTGVKSPKGIAEKVNKAIDEIIEEKTKTQEG